MFHMCERLSVFTYMNRGMPRHTILGPCTSFLGLVQHISNSRILLVSLFSKVRGRLHYLKVIDHVFSLVRRKFADTAVCGSFCVADSVLCEPFLTHTSVHNCNKTPLLHQVVLWCDHYFGLLWIHSLRWVGVCVFVCARACVRVWMAHLPGKSHPWNTNPLMLNILSGVCGEVRMHFHGKALSMMISHIMHSD